MVVNGQSSAAIGAQLHLAAKTVDTYRSRLMAKLGVGNLTALVRLAIRTGLDRFGLSRRSCVERRLRNASRTPDIRALHLS